MFNFERPRGEVDEIVYTLIDTVKLYQEILTQEDYPDSNQKLHQVKSNHIRNRMYLKFYANGRVGRFFNYDRNDVNSLNPKMARIGYYRYDKNGFYINFFSKLPQGSGWSKKRLVKCNQDTLCFKGDKLITKYKGINLPKKFLVFKPDW